MVVERLRGVRILKREDVHRVPGCWYVQGSRMLHDLDERTVAAMARASTRAIYSSGELLHEALQSACFYPADGPHYVVPTYSDRADGFDRRRYWRGPSG